MSKTITLKDGKKLFPDYPFAVVDVMTGLPIEFDKTLGDAQRTVDDWHGHNIVRIVDMSKAVI